MKKIYFSIVLFFLFAQLNGQGIVIDSVTVVSGKSVIAWQPFLNPNTDKYYIYNPNSNPPNQVIDSALKTDITKVYALSKANTESESFFVAAVDVQKNPISGFGNTSNSIYLEGLIDECNSAVNLDWNPYVYWSDGVNEYQVYMLTNGVNPRLIYSGMNTEFIFKNLLDKNVYDFYVMAKSGNELKTSTSNRINVKGNFKKAPQDIYAANLSFSSNNSLDFNWILDSASVMLEYEILISTDGVNYQSYDKINSNYKMNNLINLKNLNPNSTSYFVKINVKCDCPNQDLTSNVARSIFLKTQKNKSGENILDWNFYENWDSGVKEYKIYRKLNQTFSLLQSVSPGTNSYVDNDPMVVNSEDLTCYYIEAVENFSNTYMVEFKSLSNESCAYKDAQILVPNGFNPQKNESGLEIKLFGLDPNTFQMKLFNRFGQELFSNSDPSNLWDGKVNGKLLSTGTYIYFISVKDINGKDYKQTGFINVAY